MSLYRSATRRESLEAAWRDVLQRADEDRGPSRAVRRFARDAERGLERLAATLSDGTYAPAPLAQFDIPKTGGGTRTLSIPQVRDRIVERAVLEVVSPLADPVLSPAAYAYRPGRGVEDAITQTAIWRDEGFPWVLRTDVDDCFDTIPKDEALRRLIRLVPDSQLVTLIDMLVHRPVLTPRGLRETAGLAQGTSLSPLLMNLVLVDVDDALADAGFLHVRYADDITVVCRSATEAQRALRCATEALEVWGMRLGNDKTEIMSFADGFCFLGEDFGQRYPPVISAEERVDQDSQALYVGRAGARVYLKEGRVVVESEDDVTLISHPAGRLERLVCFGPIGVSAGLRSWALSQGIEIVLLSKRGNYLGWMEGARGIRSARVRAIAVMGEEDPRRLEWCRIVAASKITHQVTVLRRMASRCEAESVRDETVRMRGYRSMLGEATSAEEIMGLEGAAARTYFDSWSRLLPQAVAFPGRGSRPARDVTNSALNYGYAILLSQCVGALAAAGLDPNLGMLHGDDERRPSLGLDLMEEFRPIIVDSAVTVLVQQGRLGTEHVREDRYKGGVLLTKEGKSRLVDAIERRMLQPARNAVPGCSGSWRRQIHRQAQRCGSYIDGHLEMWTGVSWR